MFYHFPSPWRGFGFGSIGWFSFRGVLRGGDPRRIFWLGSPKRGETLREERLGFFSEKLRGRGRGQGQFIRIIFIRIKRKNRIVSR